VIRQPFVDLAAQYAEVREELTPEVADVLVTGIFIGGERVRRFESEFARFCGTAHCVGVASGTDALRIALLAVGVGAGDEVLTAPNSFIATAEAISQCGARPVFVDVRADTLLLDVERLEAARTPRTRAVVPVHHVQEQRQMAEMEAISAWCARHGLALVEDAAQAHGARLGVRGPGSFGAAAAFSFYPAKNLGAAGDAGAIVTDRADVAHRARLLRDHGQAERYVHEIAGFNSRLDALQAAILSVKLRHLAHWTERRRALAALYRERFEKAPGLQLVAEPREPDAHVYHLLVVRLARRDELREALAAGGIETGIHYPVPIHLQGAYHHLGYGQGSFPVAEEAAREVLSLPLYPQLSDDALHRVADTVEAFCRR